MYIFRTLTRESPQADLNLVPTEPPEVMAPGLNTATPPQNSDSQNTKNSGRNLGEYKKYLENVTRNLARAEDLKKLNSEQLHHTPEIVLNSAGDFVKILESSELSAEHLSESRKFFHACTRNESIATVIRATCLANLRELFQKNGGKKEDFDLSPFPPKISRLIEGL